VLSILIGAIDREPDLLWKARSADSHQPVRLSGWSPDGNTLAGTQHDDLWLLDMTKARVILIQTPFTERDPVFSPDGRWLAYSSDRSGSDEIYVQSFPALGAPQRLTDQGTAVEPLWSRDGRELFYRRRDSVMAISVTAGLTFVAGPPRQLFEGKFATAVVRARNYDVAPDAKHFVMVGAEVRPESAAPELRIVRNWSSRLPQ
jgi:hypothetical protein